MNLWSHMSWMWIWWLLPLAAIVALVWVIAVRSGRSSAAAPAAEVTDPVCQMQFPAQRAVTSTEYGGATYYFCAQACREEFERDPGKYAGNV